MGTAQHARTAAPTNIGRVRLVRHLRVRRHDRLDGPGAGSHVHALLVAGGRVPRLDVPGPTHLRAGRPKVSVCRSRSNYSLFLPRLMR